jgi:hypothetical protein
LIGTVIVVVDTHPSGLVTVTVIVTSDPGTPVTLNLIAFVPFPEVIDPFVMDHA